MPTIIIDKIELKSLDEDTLATKQLTWNQTTQKVGFKTILASKIIPFGQLLIFKADGNVSNDLEINDTIIGMVEGQFLNTGTYNGGDVNLMSSYIEMSPAIKLVFNDITQFISEQSITDVNDVTEWNRVLYSNGSRGCNFTEVISNGNTILLRGNFDAISRFQVYRFGLIDLYIPTLLTLSGIEIGGNLINVITPNLIAPQPALNWIDYCENPITEIQNIKNFPVLDSLDLDSCEITEIKNLNEVPSITYLGLYRNRITSLNGLNYNELPLLNQLNISQNPLASLVGIELFPLTNLEAYNCNLTDLSPLFDMNTLTNINVGNFNISSGDGYIYNNALTGQAIDAFLVNLFSQTRNDIRFNAEGIGNGYIGGPGIRAKTQILSMGGNYITVNEEPLGFIEVPITIFDGVDTLIYSTYAGLVSVLYSEDGYIFNPVGNITLAVGDNLLSVFPVVWNPLSENQYVRFQRVDNNDITSIKVPNYDINK